MSKRAKYQKIRHRAAIDYNAASLKLHKKLKGKLGVFPKVNLKNTNDLSISYTPGVAAVSRAIAKNKNLVFEYTSKANTVAVVTNGTAVLGLGDVGPEAALPVMEGKALLFKKFANIDAWPICIKTKKIDEFVKVVSELANGFGGINLEDIAAPECFKIEEKLKRRLLIPVFHDDQHGTAIVVLAGLINALKITNRSLKNSKIVISGAGAAGITIAKLLLKAGACGSTCGDTHGSKGDLIMCDSKGIIFKGRHGLNSYKKDLAKRTNKNNMRGNLKDALRDAHVFIGVSAPNIVSQQMIRSMAKYPIVFALSNPIPEIEPLEARRAGAKVVASGRSDTPNQINNVLAFPGIFRGALDNSIKTITTKMELRAAKALANLIKKPTPKKFIPSVFDPRVSKVVAEAVKSCGRSC